MKFQGALCLRGISKTFGRPGSLAAAGVHDLELEISPGEGFSLLGPSGCGKSTTLRLIGGFEHPDRGQIFHGPTEITRLPPQQRDIRTVFQRYALFPHLDVAANITFGLRIQKRNKTDIQKSLAWGLELLEIQHLKHRAIQQLSGGEQQRVALARALVTEPSVLLLDEPLSALDLKLRERMQLELLALRQKLGTTFLFVTHDQSEAMSLSDRIAVMRNGRVQQIGKPEEIYHRPSSRFVAEFIGQANFLSEAKCGLLVGDKTRLPPLAPDHHWMVRPEHLKARPRDWQPPAGNVSLAVRIVDRAFHGASRITKAVDAAGFAFLLSSPGIEPWPGQPGQEISLSWKTEDTWTVNAS